MSIGKVRDTLQMPYYHAPQQDLEPCEQRQPSRQAPQPYLRTAATDDAPSLMSEAAAHTVPAGGPTCRAHQNVARLPPDRTTTDYSGNDEQAKANIHAATVAKAAAMRRAADAIDQILHQRSRTLSAVAKISQEKHASRMQGGILWTYLDTPQDLQQHVALLQACKKQLLLIISKLEGSSCSSDDEHTHLCKEFSSAANDSFTSCTNKNVMTTHPELHVAGRAQQLWPQTSNSAAWQGAPSGIVTDSSYCNARAHQAQGRGRKDNSRCPGYQGVPKGQAQCHHRESATYEASHLLSTDKGPTEV